MTFFPAMPMPFAHERYLGRPSCPHCGEVAIAAEATAYADPGLARHSWQCDRCRRSFDTEVALAATALR